MDKFTGIINDAKFSELSLAVAKYPKSLVRWEEFLNYLISKALPLNKSLDPSIYKLIDTTYGSMLSNFPFLENYYIDYALFHYKLGNVHKMHLIYQKGLDLFDQRSLHLWVSYLKICNDVVMNNKLLFRKYETAEQHIGLHYFSGEFWELYLQQINERCKNKEKYFIVLRKVLEIPSHSFSKFYAMWLRYIDDIQDVSQLSKFASNDELSKKLKLSTSLRGRRGPYLVESQKLLKKFTKELYMVVQYQVLEIYSLFESKLKTHYYNGPDVLIPAEEIETWDKYLDYTICLHLDALTNLNFQRALVPLAHYDIIWLKYAHWLIDFAEDLVTAKNVLIRGLSLSIKKNAVMKLLYATLCKLNEYELLNVILQQNEHSHGNQIELVDDFDVFWDYILFSIFCNSNAKSRYSDHESNTFMTSEALELIVKRLSLKASRKDQMLLLSSVIQLQAKNNANIIDEKIFKHIIKSKWDYYLNDGEFWALYSRLTFFTSSLSYLEKRRRIVKEIWSQAKNHNIKNVTFLQRFCQAYLPEDMDILEDMFGI